MCLDSPKDWFKWLPLAEFWYNTTFHSAIQLTPFEILYSQPPPLHWPYLPGESANTQVDMNMTRREEMIRSLKQHLMKAQHWMKQLPDNHRTDKVFQVGDWVWLKLQPYR